MKQAYSCCQSVTSLVTCARGPRTLVFLWLHSVLASLFRCRHGAASSLSLPTRMTERPCLASTDTP